MRSPRRGTPPARSAHEGTPAWYSHCELCPVVGGGRRTEGGSGSRASPVPLTLCALLSSAGRSCPVPLRKRFAPLTGRPAEPSPASTLCEPAASRVPAERRQAVVEEGPFRGDADDAYRQTIPACARSP